jgi:HEAT repeats
MDPTPRFLHISSSTLRSIAIALLVVAPVVGQRVYPSGQTNSNSGSRNHTATIRSADSSSGSRVSITSDQSLSDYEAYRRGERFYVKIPASEVSRAEAVRGRGFSDVSSQRSGDGTTLSFRLQPGAAAHVEQRGNKLDVVISAAGGGSTTAANRSGDFRWSDASGSVNSRGANPNNRGTPANKGSNAAGNTSAGTNANKRDNQTAVANKNSASGRDNSATNPANSNSKSKPGNANSSVAGNKNSNANSSAAGNSNSTSGAATSGNANSTSAATLNTTPSPANGTAGSASSSSPTTSTQTSGAPSNSASPSPAAPTAARSDFWTRAKERGRYWLLLAQLNPVLVAIGAAILILLIALLFMQRRRAKATRRVKVAKSAPVEPRPVVPVEAAAPLATAAVAATAPASTISDEVTETTPVVAPPLATNENGRRERSSRAAEEANKIFAGETYDESVVGSDNPETRRLVGAELLAAMVGRNTERRDRARAAFMKHGYFDDATRDLRVGGSDNERAAAARRLSFAQDPEATPHLVGALSDPSPDVRRAAVEALMDQRDPAAIAPLNALLQNENDRKVPRHLIEKAIESCATNSSPASVPTAVSSAPPPAIETDREVIEI